MKQVNKKVLKVVEMCIRDSCYTLPDFPIKYDIVHSSNVKEDIYI